MHNLAKSCHVGRALLVAVALAACGQSKGARPDGAAASGGIDAAAGRPDGGEALGRGAAGEGGHGQGSTMGGATGSAVGGAGGGDAKAAGGGSSGAALEPYFRAGTRLKPRVFRAGDLEVIDQTQEGGWYDVATHDWCNFLVGADDVERCLPYATFSNDPAQIVYLDAGCTRPAVLATTPYCDRTAGAPRYITGQPSSGCDYRTYQLGDLLPITTPLYGNAGGSCESLPEATMYDGSGVWPLGPEVPLATFVAVKRVSRPRHPRMNALVREGEDGSSEIIGFSDPGTGARCFGAGLDISPQACVPDLPDAAWTGGFFGDVACTETVGVGLGGILGCGLHPATVILEVDTNAFVCPFTMSIGGLWKAAGVRAAPLFTYGADAVCTHYQSDGVVFYDQGAPIDLASIPHLDVIEVGKGPLTLAFHGFGGVPFLPAPRKFNDGPTGRFTDVARREACDPFVFPDGKWRCVPSSFDSVTENAFFYESSDCTGTRDYNVHARCGDNTRKPPGVIVAGAPQDGCTTYPVAEALELGDHVTAGPISQNPHLSSTQPACSSRPVSASMNLLRVTRELNPDEVFVPMDRGLKD